MTSPADPWRNRIVPIAARRSPLPCTLALALAVTAAVAATVLALVPSRAAAQTPASVVWITPLGLDLGTVAVGMMSAPQQVTVRNVSGQQMQVTVGAPTPASFTSTTTCPATLAAGASCMVTYRFSPTAPGDTMGSATIETTAGGTTEGNTLALHGTGLASAGTPATRLVVTPRDLDFGPVPEGTTSPAQQVTVTNTTANPAPGIVAAAPSDAAFAVSGSCADPLPMGDSCTFTYTFTAPANTPVDATSAITVPGGAVEIGLAGRTGTTGPVGDDGYFVIEQDGDLYAFGSGARALLRSLDPAAVDDAARATTVSKIVGPQLAGATAVAIELTADLHGLWILDSKGVVHELGSATDAAGVAPATLTKTVDGQPEAPAALARVGVDDLWVFSNAGRVIPQFGTLNTAAKAAMDLVLSKDLWGGINDAKPTVPGSGAYALGSDGGVFAYNAPFLGNPYTGIAKRLGVPVGSVGPDLPVSGITVDPDGNGYWVVAQDGGVFAFEAPFVGSLPAIVPFEDLFAPVNGMVAYGNGYLLVAGDGGVFNFSNLPFDGSASGLANTMVTGIAAL
jgi:hypothetical protein